MALKKIGLVTASALCSINLWTGAPLLAVWVGSKVQGNLNNLSMTAVFSVIVVLGAMVFLLATALTWLNAKYDDKPFLLLHRQRVWSECEGAWIGRASCRERV